MNNSFDVKNQTRKAFVPFILFSVSETLDFSIGGTGILFFQLYRRTQFSLLVPFFHKRWSSPSSVSEGLSNLCSYFFLTTEVFYYHFGIFFLHVQNVLKIVSQFLHLCEYSMVSSNQSDDNLFHLFSDYLEVLMNFWSCCMDGSFMTCNIIPCLKTLTHTKGCVILIVSSP
jgi:hypothetical protein